MEIQLNQMARQNHANHSSGIWIPLMDYAMKKNISLSTLRRHIKSNKVVHKIENGRYMLWDSQPLELSEVIQLQIDLQKAQEEIAELKTLVACYEEKFF